MKRHSTHWLWAAIGGISLLFLGACVDDQYSIKNIDTTVKIETQLVAPLAHTHATLQDFMPADLKGMTIMVKDDEYYIARADTQDLGNQLIGNEKVTPTGTFYLDLPLVSLLDFSGASLAGGTLPDPSGASVLPRIPFPIPGGEIPPEISHDFDITESYTFDGLNTNPNERIDSIFFDQSPLTISVSSDIQMEPGSYLEVQPVITDLKFDLSKYPNNMVRIPLESSVNQQKVNLLKTRLYLNGGNTIHFRLMGHLLTKQVLTPDMAIHISISFDGVTPFLSYLNVGDERDMYVGEKVMDFDYTQDFQVESGFFPFYNPIIAMTCENNIGVPARYYIDFVEAYDSKTGDVVRADFGGPNPDTTSVIVEAPVYEQIQGLTDDELLNLDLTTLIEETHLVFDREFGHTDRLFKINADKLRYQYRIRSVEKDRHRVQFLFQNSHMQLVEASHLALWFEGDKEHPEKNVHLTARDTIAVNLNPLDTGEITITPETKAHLDVDITNFIGLGVKTEVGFLNEAYQPILEELKDTVQITSALTNEMGIPVKEVQSPKAISVDMNYQQLEEFMQNVKYLQFLYTLRNDQQQTVQLKTTDWLEAKARMYVDGAVIFDPANLNNGGTSNAQ